MKKLNFRAMTPEEFKAYHPRTEEEEVAREAESEFRAWCEYNDEDPLDEDAYDRYHEQKEELDGFWENLSDDDRAGHEDDMHRD